MIKNVFFDFNGTILNDVNLCLDLLNELLKNQNHKTVDINKYKNIFCFPVKKYYIAAGVTFDTSDYEDIAHWFIKEYMRRYLDESSLYDGVFDTLGFLNNKGLNVYLLSASERNNLLSQLDYFNIKGFFKDVLGTSDVYAKSKSEIAEKYFLDNDIKVNETLFIGDTTHDDEIAKKLGCKSILLSIGHQSREVLLNTGSAIYDSYNELRENFDEIFN